LRGGYESCQTGNHAVPAVARATVERKNSAWTLDSCRFWASSNDHYMFGMLYGYEAEEATMKYSDDEKQQICVDYSEEAIPERDPSYQLSDATLHQTQTVDYLTAAERFVLARCLEQLGMSRARATVVATL
jgi:hypothetical protein